MAKSNVTRLSPPRPSYSAEIVSYRLNMTASAVTLLYDNVLAKRGNNEDMAVVCDALDLIREEIHRIRKMVLPQGVYPDLSKCDVPPSRSTGQS